MAEEQLKEITVAQEPGKNYFRYTVLRSNQLIWSDRVTPEELRQIADDLENKNSDKK